MYGIEVPEEFPHSQKLAEYRQQMLAIRDFFEDEFPASKEAQLTGKITHFVDVARAELEPQLEPAEIAAFSTILTAALNFLPEPSDLVLKCAINAIRYSKPPSPVYSTLLIASRAFLICEEPRRAELLANQAAKMRSDCPDAFVQLAEIYRQMEAESAPEMALNAAKTALKLHENAETWFEYGMALLRGGNLLQLAKAHNALKKAVSLHEAEKKPCPDIRFNLAMLSKIRMDFQMCWEELEIVLEENPYFEYALESKNSLEKLAAAICDKIGADSVELGLISNEADEFRGIANGLNTGELNMRVLSAIDVGVARLFVVSDISGARKCVLTIAQECGNISGKNVKIRAYMAQLIELEAVHKTYEFVALMVKNEQADVWVDGCLLSEIDLGTSA